MNDVTDKNEVNLTGTIQDEPRLTDTKNGRKLFLRLATTEPGSEDSDQLFTDYHTVVSFDKTIIEHFEALSVGAGAKVSITGKNRSGKYEDKDGKTIFSYEVHATGNIILQAKN